MPSPLDHDHCLPCLHRIAQYWLALSRRCQIITTHEAMLQNHVTVLGNITVCEYAILSRMLNELVAGQRQSICRSQTSSTTVVTYICW